VSSMWDTWVLDVTIEEPGAPYCFVPVEGDLEGEHSLVLGMNFLGAKPPGGRLVGVVHMDGQEACDRYCAEHKDELDALFTEAT
jgi:hypothetical protein